MSALLYELWDMESGNCLGAYADEVAALSDIREGISRDSVASWVTVGLFRASARDRDAALLAEGRSLIDLVIHIAE